jgi:lauroyl/myristoyl acyltransferase
MRTRTFPLWARPDLLVKDLGGLALYYPGQALVAQVPRRALGPLARLGAAAVARTGTHDDLQAELAALYPDGAFPRPPAAIVRDALRVQMYNELEVLRYGSLDPRNLDATCVVEGRSHLDDALAGGRGAIVLIAHFGANQMIMPALGHLGYPMHQLSAPPTAWLEILKDTRATPLWARVQGRRWALEQRLPVQHIDVFKFLRPAFAALARNEVLGLAFDGGGGTRWGRVPFLRRTAQLSTQSVDIWRRTRAALVPSVVVREAGATRHRVVLLPPLTWPDGGGVEEALATVAQTFEPWILAHPEHYLGFLAMRRRVARQGAGAPLFVA